MAPAEPLQAALQVAAALECCGVRYLVGGSVASSVTGEPRSTMDVDLVVALTQEDVEPLVTLRVTDLLDRALGQGQFG